MYSLKKNLFPCFRWENWGFKKVESLSAWFPSHKWQGPDVTWTWNVSHFLETLTSCIWLILTLSFSSSRPSSATLEPSGFFLQLTALLMTLWLLLVFWNKLTLFPPWGLGPSFSFLQLFPQISAQLMCSFGLQPNVTAQRGLPGSQTAVSVPRFSHPLSYSTTWYHEQTLESDTCPSDPSSSSGLNWDLCHHLWNGNVIVTYRLFASLKCCI